MADNEILEKVIRTTEIGAGSGGLLNAEQANQFIDYMWDATVLGAQVRTIRMRSETLDIDFVGVGQRLMRLATEAVDDGVNASATFSKISLTTKKLRMDFEISSEALEDSIEGAALEDHIARLMATQAGNDIEDVSINGDTALTGDPLLKAFNGWSKLAKASGHVVDNAGAVIDRGVFNKALKAMPRKYMQRRQQLKFFAGSNLIQDYLYTAQLVSTDFVTPLDLAQAGLESPVVPEGSAGFTASRPFGVTLQEVPLFAEYDVDAGTSGNQFGGDLWLTFPQNLIWGVKREVKIYRKFQPKTDSIQYTVFVRIGTQIENADAFVVVTKVLYAA